LVKGECTLEKYHSLHAVGVDLSKGDPSHCGERHGHKSHNLVWNEAVGGTVRGEMLFPAQGREQGTIRCIHTYFVGQSVSVYVLFVRMAGEVVLDLVSFTTWSSDCSCITCMGVLCLVSFSQVL
jgi:hypothetical protein